MPSARLTLMPVTLLKALPKKPSVHPVIASDNQIPTEIEFGIFSWGNWRTDLFVSMPRAWIIYEPSQVSQLHRNAKNTLAVSEVTKWQANAYIHILIASSCKCKPIWNEGGQLQWRKLPKHEWSLNIVIVDPWQPMVDKRHERNPSETKVVNYNGINCKNANEGGIS